MANEFFYGSLCLSDIPKRLIKRVKCKDGIERSYLDIKVIKRKEPSQYGHTHFVSCEPKDQQDRVEGEKYIFGDLKEYTGQQKQYVPATPSYEEVYRAPEVESDLPF